MPPSRTRAIRSMPPFVRRDLDLLDGRANLRDAVDLTQTPFGARRMRRRLARPLLDGKEIRRRQDAVRELISKPDVRFRAAEGFHALREKSLNGLTAYLASPLAVAPSILVERAFTILGALPALSFLGYGLGVLPPGMPVLASALSASVLFLNLKRVLAVRPMLYEIETWVRAMEGFVEERVAERPESDLLGELREAFAPGAVGGEAGAATWRVLRRRIGWLHVGDYGLVSQIWNVFTLWDLHFAARIDRALKANAETVIEAASALGEWESLAAFADYAEERGDTTFPIIETDGPASFEIRGGRHPYLEDDVVVANDVELAAERNVLILTGSNMAGKSTFLKMVALHLVLAQAGSPVRAEAMRLRPLRLLTVIDVEDDLVQGFSYFRVEVDRVKEVLDAAARHDRVLGIFDELFRGTNSTERVAAGREILAELSRTSGLFLMATHDMEYTTLPDVLPGACNVHFTEDVSEKGVHFTYRMRPGPATVRNALRVLEFCGIPTEIIQRARERLESSDA